MLAVLGRTNCRSEENHVGLEQSDGKQIDFTGVRFGTFGEVSKRRLMKPLWDFQQYGQCGQWVSSLFPHMAGHVDKMSVIKSMQTDQPVHPDAFVQLHTGSARFARPSIGAWTCCR